MYIYTIYIYTHHMIIYTDQYIHHIYIYKYVSQIDSQIYGWPRVLSIPSQVVDARTRHSGVRDAQWIPVVEAAQDGYILFKSLGI